MPVERKRKGPEGENPGLPAGLWRSLPGISRKLVRENADFARILRLNLEIEAEIAGLREEIAAGHTAATLGLGPEPGVPLLDFRRLPPPGEKFARFARTVLRLLRLARPELAAEAEAIEDWLSHSGPGPDRLWEFPAGEGADGEKLPDGLNAGLLAEVLEISRRPFREGAARAAGQHLPARDFHEGSCPVCGGAPYLAILRDEGGRRFLRCQACDSEWRFPRLCCPFCGNSGQERLRYLEFPPEEGKGFRVDLCLECRGYLKTYDQRAAGEIESPRLLDLATLPFDLRAEEEGYLRRPPQAESDSKK